MKESAKPEIVNARRNGMASSSRADSGEAAGATGIDP